MGSEVKVTQLDAYTTEDGELIMKYLFNTGEELTTMGDMEENK